ncbi:DUF4062 domain-containing protein [Methylobacterium sp. J-059]|uniref:DUF4062 domain-containing protein n=1 Tax=Methylobacterium sp. J-059 TaxID=2836643 RepID=UPI001FBAEE5E|nr:DUF4062 domain-containing protein [Methylobacterium sp. J-059]MCJ2042896.1 DUF4062 domain-containing protein [Methylobacterium sp. J-059]
MAYQATVIPVMIASPSDVPRERAIVREVVNEWNYVNSRSRQAVLMPTGWETHSAPELGSSTAQELINTRILEHCDLLIGVFWTRLGTPTGKAASGTAEEIERHIEAGKPALVYFSTAPVVPDSLDVEQYAALKEFRNWCQQRGLIERFNDADHFRSLLSAHLGITLNQNQFLKDLLPAAYDEPATGGRRSVTISGDAVELLLAASEDRHGIIMKVAFIGGVQINAGSRSFGDSQDRRSMARWEQALNQLLNYNLVQDMGHKGEIFELTASGYEAVDQAQAAAAARGEAHPVAEVAASEA